jgi:hypothetical protein
VAQLKRFEEKQRREVATDDLKRKLQELSKDASKLFEAKLQELEEEYPPGTDVVGDTAAIPVGLHFIPPDEQSIRFKEPKTFTIRVKDTMALDESVPVIVQSSDDNISVEPSEAFFKKFADDKKIGWTTCKLEGKRVGAEAIVEARHRGFEDLLLVNVIERKREEPIPEGLSFEKDQYYLTLNKHKSLKVRLKTDADMGRETWVSISSDHSEIVPKAGGKCRLKKVDDGPLMVGSCKVQGRQLKAKGLITAEIDGFATAQTIAQVVEREPASSIKLRFEPVEEDFGLVRYKWDDSDPYLLFIGARHPAIRKYLGQPKNGDYPGLDDPKYHAILAEVISEALAFRILRSLFRSQGDNAMLDFETTDLYFHRYFSDFLTVAHSRLVV